MLVVLVIAVVVVGLVSRTRGAWGGESVQLVRDLRTRDVVVVSALLVLVVALVGAAR